MATHGTGTAPAPYSENVARLPDGATVAVEVASSRDLLLSARCHGGGAMGAQVDTPAPTMRNPMSRMYPVSIDPSDGR